MLPNVGYTTNAKVNHLKPQEELRNATKRLALIVFCIQFTLDLLTIKWYNWRKSQFTIHIREAVIKNATLRLRYP